MSLKKYIESKKELKIKISIEEYRERLKEELSSLIIEPNIIKLEEIKKNLIDEFELNKLLEEIKYPYAEELKIILKTNNVKKISEARKKLAIWGESVIINKIISSLLFYESIFYSESISFKDIDKIIESFSNQITYKILNLSSKIEDAKEKIKWHNYPIYVEAIYPKKGFLPDEVLISVGDTFKKQFLINLDLNKVQEIDSEQELPSSLKEDSNNLLDELFKETNKNKIAILYMSRPQKERKYFENTKKEIVLGIKQFLPFNSILSESIGSQENFDVWKVRTDLNKLKRLGDQYIALTEDAPIKWVERIK